jgi:2-methylcitrate dehydratase PrpD
MMGQATKFIEYLRQKATNIPEKIVETAKDCLCDYLAVTEAGAAANKDRWAAFLEHADSGKTQVIGCEVFTDSKTAAFVNGFNAHSLELDDGQRFAMIHLGGSIISALLSAASENQIKKNELLKGIVMGYEAACRLAISMQPSHKKCGYHTAGTCGTIGSAIAVAFALNMNFRQMETVLTAALASAAGILEIQEQASELKPYNIGRAAMDGLNAAYMGFTDFIGPEDMLDGERGFLKIFSRENNLKKMTEKTDYFEVERIYIKPYAACRHCHSSIEAALKLRGKILAENISKIVVQTYHLAVKGHDHTEIAGTASAKLSIPYCVAVALITGKADVSSFALPYVNRKDIRELTKKVEVVENEQFTKESPDKRIARVIVCDAAGNSVSCQVDYAKGEPENPMSRQEIICKACSLVGDQAEKIIAYAYKDVKGE